MKKRKLSEMWWDKTGFVTTDFEEAVLWIAVLSERKMIFGMTVRDYGEGGLRYVFVVNANSLIAEDLIEDDGFHDPFPVVSGSIGLC